VRPLRAPRLASARAHDGDASSFDLQEEPPTEDEAPLVRGGWYRGPRGPVVFALRCPACGAGWRWFRSAAAAVTLTPRRWGRLCGEQEDARAALAAHLHIPLRVAVPLDWEHQLGDSGLHPV
jgi:hypothetical protein